MLRRVDFELSLYHVNASACGDFAVPEICVCPANLKIHPNANMKTPSFRRTHGFTLVELLVVIAIIAVLAAAGFAAGNAAIQKARKVTALASATAIETAVNNFFTEYGSMPSAASSDTTVKTDDATLLTVLLGLETGSNVLNTRGVKFLSVKEGKNKKGGLIYNPNGNSVTGLYDPWGGPYNVALDLDYDEQVKPAPKAGGAVTLNGRRVAVWSDGADYKGTNKATDDVKTWGQ
jgi:prepilin-type N-terminal cleavage/methylation domain-containing protein